MGAGSAEIWVCANCRSVNKARAKQCYNCRTPRDLAAVDPAQLEVTGQGQVREVALPAFRSSRGRAVLAPPAELHLVVRVQASGALVAELGGGAETVTLDELRAAAHALSRARGSATVQVVGQGDRARAAAREAFGVLSDAGVPTVFEG